MKNQTARTVMLGNVPVGRSHPPVFMAEVGTFFNSDLGHALRLLERVKSAGVKVFKTEVLHTANVVLPRSGLQHTYTHAKGQTTEDYRSLIERKVMPLSHYATLFKECRKENIEFVCSVYDCSGVDFVVDQGGCALKIARNNVNNVPLIRHAAQYGIPLIFDMGEVYVDEIAWAVRFARESGADDVIVNIHPGVNPAPAAAHNLGIAQHMSEVLNCPIGLSCHYIGADMLCAAAALGISLLEKGVDFDPNRAEQDLVSALQVSEISSSMDRVHACWEATNGLVNVPKDRDIRTRSGIVARARILPGDMLTAENVGFAWPALGISVSQWDEVIGRRVIAEIDVETPITWSAIDGNR